MNEVNAKRLALLSLIAFYIISMIHYVHELYNDVNVIFNTNMLLLGCLFWVGVALSVKYKKVK